jgi:hypothetical protein
MNWGLFEPLVMYFVLTNSPATFQTMMNEILSQRELSLSISMTSWSSPTHWTNIDTSCNWVVLSDQESQFIEEFMCEVYWQLGIKLAILMAYYLQTDGQTEWVNQSLRGIFRTSQINTRITGTSCCLLASLITTTICTHQYNSLLSWSILVGILTWALSLSSQDQHWKNDFMDHMVEGLAEAKVVLTKVKDEYIMYYNHLHKSLPQVTRSD